MASMPMQQQAAAAPHPEGARRAVDERHYRKINIFNGTGWKDFSFQFKAATRSSHEVAFDLLCWAELEQSDIDPLDGYATAWRLVCPGHLPHIEDLCTDTSAEIR